MRSFMVLKDFTYDHQAQDVNKGLYEFKIGEIIKLPPLYGSEGDFMPDRSNVVEVIEII